MTTSMKHGMFVTLLAAGLLGGCSGPQDATEALDPNLVQIDDGKADGPPVQLHATHDYRIQVNGLEAYPDITDHSLDEWQLPPQPALVLTVEDARTTVCDDTVCTFGPGHPLNLDSGEERRFSGQELRDGVAFSVHDMNSGSSLVDDVIGLTRIHIGQTGSLKIKPFGKVKSITFTIKF